LRVRLRLAILLFIIHRESISLREYYWGGNQNPRRERPAIRCWRAAAETVNGNKSGVLIYIYGSSCFVFPGIFQICDWQASPNSGSIFQSMGHI
jgi:hypothetical protein